MHFYTINENRNAQDQIVGSLLWAGRSFWQLNKEYGFKKKEIRFSWYFAAHARHTMLQFNTDFVDDRAIHFAIGIFHLFTFFFAISLPIFPSWDYKHGDRTSGIRIFDEAIWFDLWVNDNEWDSRSHWWTKPICISPIDIIFGRTNYQSNEADAPVVERVISMPEGDYSASVRLYTAIWTRPRLPLWKRIVQRAEVGVDIGVPVPGKGENSWDLGEGAIFGITMPAKTIDEAIQAFIESVNSSRLKYGGKNWLPENKTAG